MVKRVDMLEAVIEIIELRDEWAQNYTHEEAYETFMRGCMKVFHRIVEKDKAETPEPPTEPV